jgi:hypothetical protein
VNFQGRPLKWSLRQAREDKMISNKFTIFLANNKSEKLLFKKKIIKSKKKKKKQK